MEEGKYAASVMVINSRRYNLDDSLEVSKPTIREFMHYFVKEGKEYAEAIAKEYM